MADPALTFVLLGAATAACSMAVSKGSVFGPVRSLAERRGPGWLAELLGCPYCLSHWFGAALVLGGGAGPWFDRLVLVLAVIALATVIVGAMSRLLLIPEAERAQLRHLLQQANARAAANTKGSP